MTELSADQVIDKAIENGGLINLLDFKPLYNSSYEKAKVGTTTLGTILSGARMILSDVLIPIEDLQRMRDQKKNVD